jgi:hypothetical protein
MVQPRVLVWLGLPDIQTSRVITDLLTKFARSHLELVLHCLKS